MFNLTHITGTNSCKSNSEYRIRIHATLESNEGPIRNSKSHTDLGPIWIDWAGHEPADGFQSQVPINICRKADTAVLGIAFKWHQIELNDRLRKRSTPYARTYGQCEYGRKIRIQDGGYLSQKKKEKKKKKQEKNVNQIYQNTLQVQTYYWISNINWYRLQK